MVTKAKIYEGVGRTLAHANALETELGTVLLIFDGLKTRSYVKPDADAYARLCKDINKNTLGQSLGQLKDKYMDFPDDVAKTLKDGVEARNFIAHHYFRHHGLSIQHAGGRVAMLAHVEELWRTIDEAYAEAQRMSHALRVLLGAMMSRSQRRGA